MGVSHKAGADGNGLGPLALSLLGAAALAVAACAAPDERREAEIAAAELASSQGEWVRAAALWHGIYFDDGGRNTRACRECARALFFSGDADSACAMVELGLESAPADPDLLELHGRVLEASGYRRAAELSHSRAVAADPGRIYSLVALGRLRLQLGYEIAAVEPLQRAVDFSGGSVEALALLGRARAAGGEDALAFEAYAKAAAKTGECDADTLLAAARLGLGESVRTARADAVGLALGWAGEVATREPQRTLAHVLLGRASELAGRLEAAVQHYRRAVETDPSNAEALADLASLHVRMGDSEAASDMVRRALEVELDPTRRTHLIELLEAGPAGGL
ncbi:MAG: tetratricopeptide repeat protein [Planctomycetota bacterium]|jgi:tetratricopeptide (TPR) repeat protein|nr:tetratricopeptide repeat protein [Planctomycetota bacterium]MDP6762744.1 tetratricopeptide repeat protein [Planctomycetota bacterium]MDP6988530.1 tetratricopeptide repeat protein [Planctomycetota bacterium]